MLRSKLKDTTTKDQKGFTIIEVLIVLAIAGLILLIVFLAVPALQRNSRNTSYRNEAAQLLSAATENSTNNDGKVPVTADSATILGLTKNRTITGLNVVTGSGSSTPTFSTAVLRTGAKCDPAATAGAAAYTTVTGPSRALALIYAIENSSGTVVAQCQES